MKKFLLGISIVIVVPLLAVGIAFGPKIAQFMHIQVVEIDPQMKVFLGGGGNSIVLTSEDKREVLIVDTKMGPGAKRLKKYVDSLGPDAKVTIVNTHDHGDHAGGNNLFPKAVIIAGDYPDDVWKRDVGPRLPDEKVAMGADKVLVIGSENVRIHNMGQAHTLADTIVYFEKRKILHTGDLVFNHMHPVLKQESGANVGKWVLALDDILAHYDIAQVVPGHGPLTDKNGLVEQREYFTSIAAALGDQAQLARLEQKYSAYFALPVMSGFAQTVKYIENEKK